MPSPLRLFSVKAQNLKCFEDWQGFDTFCPINLIVGRNNCGKSTLLDMVEQITHSKKDKPKLSRAQNPAEITIGCALTEQIVDQYIPNGTQVSGLTNSVSTRTARELCTGRQVVRVFGGDQKGTPRFLGIDGGEEGNQTACQLLTHISKQLGNPFADLHAVRLRADRDIKPEVTKDLVSCVGDRGEDATQLVFQFLNSDRADQRRVEEGLLHDLNRILAPDWRFTRISTKYRENKRDEWELHLEADNGPPIRLSDLGSGLKTVLLVLINLHLVPSALNKALAQFVFCFEELENNLHPAAQRQLFQYLREKAVQEKCTFFITTHSGVVIDQFSKDEAAQIVHVTHEKTRAKVEAVKCHLSRNHVLDDLGMRASDLLQANAIVWVEGPSDRLFFNRWVELWSGGTLKEQVHYQCLWYGGATLANLTFKADADRSGDTDEDNKVPAEDLAAALRVNRNAIILMDSDCRSAQDDLKKRVKRVQQEALANNVTFPWVTFGREVENYIPVEALREALRQPDLTPPGRYDSVYEHVGRSGSDKVAFASRIVPLLTRPMLAEDADLAERLDQISKLIRGWNGM